MKTFIKIILGLCLLSFILPASVYGVGVSCEPHEQEVLRGSKGAMFIRDCIPLVPEDCPNAFGQDTSGRTYCITDDISTARLWVSSDSGSETYRYYFGKSGFDDICQTLTLIRPLGNVDYFPVTFEWSAVNIPAADSDLYTYEFRILDEIESYLGVTEIEYREQLPLSQTSITPDVSSSIYRFDFSWEVVLLDATGEFLCRRISENNMRYVPPAVPADCYGIRPTSPTGGIGYNNSTFYWDTANQPIDAYRINIYDAGNGNLIYSTDVPYPANSTTLDMNAILRDYNDNQFLESTIRWEVGAVNDGVVQCTRLTDAMAIDAGTFGGAAGSSDEPPTDNNTNPAPEETEEPEDPYDGL